MRKCWLGWLLLWFWNPLWGLDPNQLYLTLEEEALTSLSIQWLLPNEGEAKLEYQKEGEQSWQSASGTTQPLPKTELTHYRVILENLDPGARYAFRFDEEDLFYFSTPSLDNLNFAVGGDIFHDNWEMCSVTTRHIGEKAPMFVVLGGDLAYACSNMTWGKENMTRWLAFLNHLKEELRTPTGDLIPVAPVIGNHDVNGRYGSKPENAITYYTLFGDPIYTLDFGNQMSLLILDSNHCHTIKSQKKWIENELEARQEVPHKFVFYHVASLPSHRSPGKKFAKKIQREWAPKFEKGAVSLVFEHHDHAYKRTHPWKKGRVHNEGIIYLGDGCWGASPRGVKKKRHYLAHAEARQHYLHVRVHEKRREVDAIAPQTGEIFDRLTQHIR